MARRDDIYAALRSSIDDGDRIVVLHSSLFAFRTPLDGLKWDLLTALRRLIDDGLTLALPAVTFEFCRTREYHYRRSVANTGVLVEWFLELPEVRRTPHPVYPFAVAGPLSGRLLECDSAASFGAGTVFEVFEHEPTRIVMFGADWNSCTQLHRYEELARVPYRHDLTVAGQADYGSGVVAAEVRMFVRDVALESTLDFAPVVAGLRENRLIRSVDLFGRGVESVSIVDLSRVATGLIAADPYVLVREPRVVEHRARVNARGPVRLAVLGSRNLEVLAAELASLGGQQVSVYTPDYGQHAQAVLAPDSALYEFAPEVTFFVERLEDVFGVDELSHVVVDEAVAAYVDLIARYAQRSDRPILVNSFAVLQSTVDGIGSVLVERANTLLRNGISGLDQVHLVDLAEVVAAPDAGAPVDIRLWLVARVPFARAFSAALARRLWGKVLATLGRTARLIVVDLDNTLWHGVLGEDGLDGIQVGPDHPGNAHQRLQRALRVLRERGVALAVCSKNDAEPALRAIREHTGMVLREQDFVAFEIGWRPKWQAIRDLAGSLNLGLENVLFVDDNPVERDYVRQRLPQVAVLELPGDPSGYADALLASPFVAALEVTDADRGRTEQYRARRAALTERARYDDVEDFYASLGIVLQVDPLTEGNIARAEQLCAKTNQFNVTTKRYSRAELRRLAASPGWSVHVLSVSDRFSAREELGLLVLSCDGRVATVDTYLLSCRVLGRGVETGVLRWLAGRLGAEGVRELRGTVVETERNTPCRRVFADTGFEPADGSWRLELAGQTGAPPWLTVVDNTRGEQSCAS